jgi:hypothetical protein
MTDACVSSRSGEAQHSLAEANVRWVTGNEGLARAVFADESEYQTTLHMDWVKPPRPPPTKIAVTKERKLAQLAELAELADKLAELSELAEFAFRIIRRISRISR